MGEPFWVGQAVGKPHEKTPEPDKVMMKMSSVPVALVVWTWMGEIFWVAKEKSPGTQRELPTGAQRKQTMIWPEQPERMKRAPVAILSSVGRLRTRAPP